LNLFGNISYNNNNNQFNIYGAVIILGPLQKSNSNLCIALRQV